LQSFSSTFVSAGSFVSFVSFMVRSSRRGNLSEDDLPVHDEFHIGYATPRPRPLARFVRRVGRYEYRNGASGARLAVGVPLDGGEAFDKNGGLVMLRASRENGEER
jgi:hypothetical protein